MDEWYHLNPIVGEPAQDVIWIKLLPNGDTITTKNGEPILPEEIFDQITVNGVDFIPEGADDR